MSHFRPSPAQIQKWVEANIPDHKIRGGGKQIIINNPFDGDTGYHMHITIEDGDGFGLVHDWRGNHWAGAVTKTGKRNCHFTNFVKLFLNCTYRQAVRAISSSAAGLPSLKAPRRRSDVEGAKEKPTIALPEGSFPLLTSQRPLASQTVISWLESRGVDRTAIAQYNIHHTATNAVWPYYEYEVLVYWQARSAVTKAFDFPSEAKCGVSKGQFLYNFDNIEPASDLYVVEAIFGVMTLRHQTTASGGATLAPDQVKKITLLGPRKGVVLAPDNDAAGLRSIAYNAALLQERGLKVSYTIPERMPNPKKPGGIIKDWNEMYTDLRMTHDEIWQKMESGIKPFTLSARIKLNQLASQLEREKAGRPLG